MVLLVHPGDDQEGVMRTDNSDPGVITVKQINLKHSKMSQMHVNNWIDWHRSSRYICLVQELYVYNQIASNQPRTATRFVGGDNNTPRTAIYIGKNLNAWYIEELSNRDATVIIIKINNRQTMVASIYLDRNKDVVQPWLLKLMQYRQQRGYALLIGADSNCHSSLFGHETNKRGETLEEFITTYRLSVENQGKRYPYNCSTGRSIIDIALTARLAVTISNWRVAEEEINFSDHNSIYFELKTDKYTPPKARKWHLADWSLFRETLKENNIRIQADITFTRLAKCLHEWYDHVNQALNQACPKRKVRLKDLNNP